MKASAFLMNTRIWKGVGVASATLIARRPNRLQTESEHMVSLRTGESVIYFNPHLV